MASIDDLLKRWRAAGLIDESTVARITAFERSHAKESQDLPTIPEALVYVGLAAVAVGAIILGAILWEDVTPAGRLLLLTVASVVVIALGALLLQRPDPPARRGGAIAWLAGVPLVAGTVAVALYEQDVAGHRVFLGAGIAAAITGGIAWLLSPTRPQVLGLGLALGVVAFAANIDAIEEDVVNEGPTVFASLLVALSIGWLLVTEQGWLAPRDIARPLGALGLAIGAYSGSLGNEFEVFFEVLVLAVGAGLIALSVQRAVFVYMAVGVAALFMGAITTILKRVPDPAVGAGVVMVAGILLIAAVFLLERWRPWRREGSPA